MRLTLRTLLAYLDGILDPADADDLGKKVEESEYAAGLIHRIRDVMRRQRLGSPNPTDRGPGLDPNTVAEYLDNTLAAEQVIDFEKVCLDSDVHLAEVASSHQILTLVLGEPAEVDPASRERMYRLSDVDSAEKKPVAAPPPLNVHSTLDMPEEKSPPRLELEPGGTSRTPRRKPTIPEYLREPRKKSPWPSIVVVSVLALCFIGVILMAFGQFEPGTPLGKLFVRWGIVSAPADREIADKTTTGAEDRTRERAERPSQPPMPADTDEPPAATPVEPSTAERPTEPEQPPSPAEPADQSLPTETGPLSPVVPEPSQPVELPPSKSPAGPDVPTERPADESPATLPEPAAPDEATTSPATATEPKKPPTHELPPMPPEPLGRLMSSEQVLLSRGASGGWTRVAANQMLIPQEVMALPTYRAKIALTIGVTLDALGGSRVELLGSTARDLPGVHIAYGRVVLMPLGKVGSSMRLTFGDRTGTIVFDDADTMVALDVRRLRLPGGNPESKPDRIVADLYVKTGGITWEEAGENGVPAQPIRLVAGQQLQFDGQLTSAPIAIGDPPPWIESMQVSQLDRRASLAIADALPTDRLARVGLMEIAVSRPQREVKWLALRCLGYLGLFEDMVVALNDPAYKLVWADYVSELCAAVDRDAETAAAVRMAFEKQYPQQALAMYRMLGGYSNQDLQAGEDAVLVRGLDDDLLAVRVLSYWNLKDITGQGAAYQPEQTAARRQQAVRRWRQRRDAKEIRHTGEGKGVDAT